MTGGGLVFDPFGSATRLTRKLIKGIPRIPMRRQVYTPHVQNKSSHNLGDKTHGTTE